MSRRSRSTLDVQRSAGSIVCESAEMTLCAVFMKSPLPCLQNDSGDLELDDALPVVAPFEQHLVGVLAQLRAR